MTYVSKFFLVILLSVCVIGFAEDHGSVSRSAHRPADDTPSEIEAFIKEAKEKCNTAMDKNWPSLTLYLMSGELPKSMQTSTFHVQIKNQDGINTGYVLPDERASMPMTVIPLLGKTKEEGGKTYVEYKITKSIHWSPPGAFTGIHLPGTESDWLKIDKQGLCLDFGVKPIPLRIKTGKAADHPEVKSVIGINMEYKLGDKVVQYSVDLRKPKVATAEEGVFQTEILIPSELADVPFKYTIKYFTNNGLKTVEGEQTHESKNAEEEIDVSKKL